MLSRIRCFFTAECQQKLQRTHNLRQFVASSLYDFPAIGLFEQIYCPPQGGNPGPPVRLGGAACLVVLVAQLVEAKTMPNDKHKPFGYIFRTWITRNGVRVYAKQYGLKAWRIPVYRNK
jgi:hypothetical protein